MPKTLIHGIEVDFPHEPYQVQKTYMGKVLECILRHTDGILESPTGTGKTLSLLCASLAWLRYYKKEMGRLGGVESTEGVGTQISGSNENWGRTRIPKIIYASRTHSQISQVMTELKHTDYKDAKVTVLGSRDQLCIHPEVSQAESLSLKNSLCRIQVKAKSCMYANRVENAKQNKLMVDGIQDIEDLVTKSKKLSCCPFYLARELQDSSDIIFMPYNYLLDPQIRSSMNIMLLDSIVILDEGHNIEKMCEEAASICISNLEVAIAIEEVTKDMVQWYKDVQEGWPSDVERDYTENDLCSIKEKLQKFEGFFASLEPQSNSTVGVTHNGSYIFTVLDQAQITYENYGEVVCLLSKISESVAAIHDRSLFARTGSALKKLADCLTTIFSTVGPDKNMLIPDKFFKVHIECETKKKFSNNSWLSTAGEQNSDRTKKLNYWCFNPGFGMAGLKKTGIRCVIITSGTLSPLPAIIKELALHEPVTLENPHIIKPSQVLIGVISKGPRNIELNSCYQNRHNENYWHELGLTLQNFSRIVPDGLLVFFPSYVTLKKAQDIWQGNGLWQKINTQKPIYVEPQGKGTLASVMNDFYRSIESGNGKGAILMGVCRGKVSEGLDFSNQFGRGVMITGLPYPPLHEPKISLKKQYVDRNHGRIREMTGEIWYHCEATRAVNQAIGRVIRHSQDFGAILLCDSRFGSLSVCTYLSKWLQPHVTKTKNFGEAISSLGGFFKRNNTQVPNTSGYVNRTVLEPKEKNSGNCVATNQGTQTSIDKIKLLYGNKTPKPKTESSTPGPSRKLSSIELVDLCDEENNENFVPVLLKEKMEREGLFPDLITKNTSIEVQPAKKRKIKLAPIRFDLSSSAALPEDVAYETRTNEIRNFLCEVKTTLDGTSYASFTIIIKKYQQSNSFEEILGSLKTLFLQEDSSFKVLFKGCGRLFSGKHKKLFDDFCEGHNL